MARTSEKWPTSADSSIFCLSMAATRRYCKRTVPDTLLGLTQWCADRPGWLELPPSLAMLPFEADALFDMACCVCSKPTRKRGLLLVTKGRWGRVPGVEKGEALKLECSLGRVTVTVLAGY
jgi:hypothetical protein